MDKHTYYTQQDVAQHSTPGDCWLSHHGRVYDYTPLIRESESNLTEALVRAAGQDVTHWFSPETGDLQTLEDPLSGRPIYRTPYGLPLLHCPSPYPGADKETPPETPWWRDESYQVGLLSACSRPLEILNTLTGHRHLITVPAEETIAEIASRYSRYNSAALTGYQWRYQGEDLQMDKTLDENGIADEREVYLRLNWPENQWYTPVITLIWKDELL